MQRMGLIWLVSCLVSISRKLQLGLSCIYHWLTDGFNIHGYQEYNTMPQWLRIWVSKFPNLSPKPNTMMEVMESRHQLFLFVTKHQLCKHQETLVTAKSCVYSKPSQEQEDPATGSADSILDVSKDEGYRLEECPSLDKKTEKTKP